MVIFALWRIASANIASEQQLSDDFYDRAWAAIHPAYMPCGEVGEAEHRLVRLAAVQAAARDVSAAAPGSRLQLPVSAQELEAALRDFLLAVDQNDELLEELSLDEQLDIARCRDAAAHLLWEVGEQPSPPLLMPPDFDDTPRVFRVRPQRDDAALPSN